MKAVHIAVQHLAKDTRIYLKECRTLARAGHDVHLLVGKCPAEHDPDITFHKGAAYPPLRSILRWCVAYPRCLWANFRKARSLSADLYHVHETPLIPVGLLLVLLGRRVVYDVHEDAPRQAIVYGRAGRKTVAGYALSLMYSLYEAIARWLFHGFVAATPQIAKKFPAKRTAVVQNFVLEDEARSIAEQSKRVVYKLRGKNVVCVGGLFRTRGVVEMVDAVGQLPDTLQSQLLLAGKFDSDALRNECEAMPGWQHVEYLGVVDRAGVFEVLSRARVGLVTLHPVGQYPVSWPVKIFEYMAAGLPVVASDFPLWREVFGPFDFIRFVDPLDPQQIAEAVEYVLQNEDEAEAMGRRGREAALQHFNWETEAKKLVALYEKLGT